MTDKFNPDSGASGTPTIPRATNWSEGSVNFVGPDGKVVKSATPDANGQVRYTTTVGSKGINGITGRFTGNGVTDTSYFHATDANGYGATQSIAGTVDQVVAGPGIYISSPNGQGVVTVSTEPLPTNATSDIIYDVSWIYDTTDRGFGIVGEFIAVGVNGLNMRSRDGINWVQMAPSGQTIIGISVEQSSTIPNNNVEYNGVGLSGRSIYGRNGTNKDAMITVSQLSDQNGPINQTFISTDIYEANSAATQGETGGGTGGGGIPSTGTFVIFYNWDRFLGSYPDSEEGNYNYGVAPYSSEGTEIDVSLSLSSTGWWDVFGLDQATYGENGDGEFQTITCSVSFNGTVISNPSQSYSWFIRDTSLSFTITSLFSPINTVPAQSRIPGILYTPAGQSITFSQNTINTISITLYVTDINGILRTATTTKYIAWI